MVLFVCVCYRYVHLLFNVIVQVVVGIPLEMVHGSFRIFIVYMAGVLAGSPFTSVLFVLLLPLHLFVVVAVVNSSSSNIDNINNDNFNNDTEKRKSRFLTISSLCLHPTHTVMWPGRSRVQITCVIWGAYHVQHTVCHMAWHEGTAQLLSLTGLKSHLFYFKLLFDWLNKPAKE